MNRKNYEPSTGKKIAGYLLGAAVAVISPLLMLTELFSLFSVVMIPTVALVVIARWSGRAPAMFAAFLQMLISAMYIGSAFLWMSFFMVLMPLVSVLRNENKPFFVQIRSAIISFGLGVVFTVLALYLDYGGNMIERVLARLPEAVRALPQEYAAVLLESFGNTLGSAISLDELYLLFDQAIQTLIPVYQLKLPGLIFGGALISAVICVGLNGYMRKRKGNAPAGAYVPLRAWALPASTTGGLLLILAVSLGLSVAGVQHGETVLYTVYNIAAAAFCIQSIGSLARHMYGSRMGRGARIFIIIALAGLCITGASIYVTIYGVASAIFGRKGVLRQRMENANTQDKNNFNGNE